jgi:hypothetical protein
VSEGREQKRGPLGRLRVCWKEKHFPGISQGKRSDDEHIGQHVACLSQVAFFIWRFSSGLSMLENADSRRLFFGEFPWAIWQAPASDKSIYKFIY